MCHASSIFQFNRFLSSANPSDGQPQTSSRSTTLRASLNPPSHFRLPISFRSIDGGEVSHHDFIPGKFISTKHIRDFLIRCHALV